MYAPIGNSRSFYKTMIGTTAKVGLALARTPHDEDRNVHEEIEHLLKEMRKRSE